MRGHIQKRGKQSWRISVSLGKGPDGKYRYYRETVRGTKADAERRLAEVLVELEADQLVMPQNITLATLLERWLEDFVRPNRAPRTYTFYKDLSETYLIPHLGQVKVQKLRSLTIQRLYSELLSKGGKQGQGLSETTVRHIHATLSAALSYAVKHKLVRSNPCQDVVPPTPRKQPPKVWTPDEVNLVLKAAGKERYGIYFFLVLHTGMRVNEALALRWVNVDLDKRIITIQEAVKGKATRGRVIGNPKTSSGIRRVPFGEKLEKALRKHKTKQAQEKLAMGSSYTDRDLVIATRTGNYVNPENIRNRTLKRITAKAGVPKIPLKNLRHTHATMLLTAGVHPKVVQERLGHSDIGVTLNIYSSVLPNIQEAAAASFDDLLNSTQTNDG